VFQSVASILITGLITLFLVLLITLKKNPLSVIFRFGKELLKSKLLLAHFLGVLSVLLLNKLELIAESRLTSTADYTHYIYLFEGNVTPLLQKWLNNDGLTLVATFFYVIVFTVLMFASLLVYHDERDRRSLYALLYGFGLNYVIAIPFFLFVPVNETWYTHPQVSALFLKVYPLFEEQYRHFSGLDNSFPSLHTSISLTMAMIALRSRNLRFAWLTSLSAGMILFSVIYLGIHWFSDVIAGIVLASVTTGLAYRLSEYPLGTRQLVLPSPGKARAEQHPY
jgi:membrane-associated phospholipid phosphatase